MTTKINTNFKILGRPVRWFEFNFGRRRLGDYTRGKCLTPALFWEGCKTSKKILIHWLGWELSFEVVMGFTDLEIERINNNLNPYTGQPAN